MKVIGPVQNVRDACEQILRSLPAWFGIESALMEYVEATDRLPTYLAMSEGKAVGFVSLQSHSQSECEIHCIAVRDSFRGRGVGKALVQAAERWMKERGATRLIVKTIAESHPSPEYKESRAFYQSQGFLAEKIIPDIWGPSNPCLQMYKELHNG
ncbi:GNAT family N-acetyltransferase [Uliginosibacterium sediminicola]|uniref:GNAT family N-acetyltransferase n=1 Tax=Uliginosibacterium sediminicola TaxID=2024550 RepID=A0ABU9YUZ5_9RHOO